MRKGLIIVTNRLGLHARAAAKLVKAAGWFESRILISTEDGLTTVNAKSILSVLTLAALRGHSLILEVDGADEDIAFESIKGLFESGFGEE